MGKLFRRVAAAIIAKGISKLVGKLFAGGWE